MEGRGEEPALSHMCSVQPLQKHIQLGEFHHLLQELRLDDSRFQRYFGLTGDQFEDLLARAGTKISRQDTSYRRYISAAECLSICLR